MEEVEAFSEDTQSLGGEDSTGVGAVGVDDGGEIVAVDAEEVEATRVV